MSTPTINPNMMQDLNRMQAMFDSSKEFQFQANKMKMEHTQAMTALEAGKNAWDKVRA